MAAAISTLSVMRFASWPLKTSLETLIFCYVSSNTNELELINTSILQGTSGMKEVFRKVFLIFQKMFGCSCVRGVSVQVTHASLIAL